MDGLIIHTVLQGLFIQEVKEIFDSWRHDGPGAEDATEEVIDKLLQRSLKQAKNDVRWGCETAVTKPCEASICPQSDAKAVSLQVY